MQIIIEIDENVYTRLFDNGTEDCAIVNDDLFKIAKSIRKGTPIPKKCRLIDANALINSTDKEYVHKYEIALAPTIIEANENSQFEEMRKLTINECLKNELREYKGEEE